VIKAKMELMTENAKLLQLFKQGENQGKEFRKDHSQTFQKSKVEKVEARREEMTELKKKKKFNPSILKNLEKLCNQVLSSLVK
jgi:accessory colonization factor AcfC